MRNPMNYPDLKGKTVFVTGSNRGIGKAIAEEFIKNDCQVIAAYRKDKPNFDLVDGDMGITFLELDINDTEKISNWLLEFEEKGGKVDVLVNNAGILLTNPLLEVTEKEWDMLIDTNLKATFFLSQLFAKHMKENKRGVIINAGSFAAKMPSASAGAYAASKAALLNLTKSMAAEWAQYNIRVNSFSPGVIETELTKPAREKNEEKMLGQISLNRFGKTEEVAKAVSFLASGSASYISGIDLDISGGKLIIQNPSDAWNKKIIGLQE